MSETSDATRDAGRDLKEMAKAALQLSEKATPGPWITVDDGSSAGIASKPLVDQRIAEGRNIYAYPDVCGGDACEGYFVGPDANFIAFARESLPALATAFLLRCELDELHNEVANNCIDLHAKLAKSESDRAKAVEALRDIVTSIGTPGSFLKDYSERVLRELGEL